MSTVVDMSPLTWLTRGAQGTPLGWLLVGIQGLLFLLIGFWPGTWGPRSVDLPWWGLALFVVGGAGMIGAAMNLGPSLTPLPEPNGEGVRTGGLYALVRHPMYASILVVCTGVALARGSWVVWGWVLALYVLFEVKTRREERFLVSHYEDYAAYAAGTGKFLPGVQRRR